MDEEEKAEIEKEMDEMIDKYVNEKFPKIMKALMDNEIVKKQIETAERTACALERIAKALEEKK